MARRCHHPPVLFRRLERSRSPQHLSITRRIFAVALPSPSHHPQRMTSLIVALPERLSPFAVGRMRPDAPLCSHTLLRALLPASTLSPRPILEISFFSNLFSPQFLTRVPSLYCALSTQKFTQPLASLPVIPPNRDGLWQFGRRRSLAPHVLPHLPFPHSHFWYRYYCAKVVKFRTQKTCEGTSAKL